jgi:predicted dehydrogenase
VELHGERGSIVLDGNDISFWKLTDTGEEEEELERLRSGEGPGAAGHAGGQNGARRLNAASDPMALDISGHQLQIEDFVAAIREERAPAVDGPESLKALEIVLAVYRSAELGRPVELPLAEGKGQRAPAQPHDEA